MYATPGPRVKDCIMGAIHRTTISIPQDLKERMEAIKDQANWSAVAARAFEAELGRIAMKRSRSMSREDVIKRLQAALKQEAGQSVAVGTGHGRRWAELRATPKDLRRLMRLFEASREWESFADLHRALDPSGNCSKDEMTAYTGIEEEMHDDPFFIRAFVEGATDVWEEVKNEL
jgi:hypothetical protein